MRKIVQLSLASLLIAAPAISRAECNSQQTGGGEVVGTLLGAAVGGLIGSQIGGGVGNSIAIGAGVLAGGMLGNKLGKNLDCQDQQYHGTTANTAFEQQKTGTTATWVNPDSGHSGSVTPTRTYMSESGAPCREFEQEVIVGGEKQKGYGTACRQNDGSWQVVSAY